MSRSSKFWHLKGNGNLFRTIWRNWNFACFYTVWVRPKVKRVGLQRPCLRNASWDVRTFQASFFSSLFIFLAFFKYFYGFHVRDWWEVRQRVMLESVSNISKLRWRSAGYIFYDSFTNSTLTNRLKINTNGPKQSKKSVGRIEFFSLSALNENLFRRLLLSCKFTENMKCGFWSPTKPPNRETWAHQPDDDEIIQQLEY